MPFKQISHNIPSTPIVIGGGSGAPVVTDEGVGVAAHPTWDYGRGIFVTDDAANDRIRIEARDEVIWTGSPEFGLSTDGTGDARPGLQAALDKSALTNDRGVVVYTPGPARTISTKQTNVSGFTSKTLTGVGLVVPGNRQFVSAGAGKGGPPTTSKLVFSSSVFGAGDYFIGVKASSTLVDPALGGFWLTSSSGSSAATKAAAVPSLPDAVFVDRTTIQNVYIDGNIRYAFGMWTDHSIIRQCRAQNTWAVLGFLANNPVEEDMIFDTLRGTGGYCFGYLETGRPGGISGHRFINCHLGITMGPRFYATGVGTQSQFVANCLFDGCAWEGSAGMFVDTSKTGSISYVTIRNHRPVSLAFDGNVAAGPNTASGAPGPLIQAADVRHCLFEGKVVSGAGWDPATGCAIDVNNLFDNELGDITDGVAMARKWGVPFARVSSSVVRTFGQFGWDEQNASANNKIRRVRLIKNSSGVAVMRGEVMRRRAVTTSETMQRFDNVSSGQVAGTMLMPAANNEIGIVVTGTVADVATSRLGSHTTNGSVTFPVAAATASSTLSSAVGLGSGLVPRLANFTVVNPLPSTIKIVNGADLPTSGELSVDAYVIAYTGYDAANSQLTGCTLVVGSPASGATVDGGDALGRVATLASNTGFKATGGVALIGSQYVTYTATAAGNRLIGITNGAGTQTVGATVADQSFVKLTNYYQLLEMPTGAASAVVRTGSTYTQVVYDSAVVDKMTQYLLNGMGAFLVNPRLGTGTFGSGSVVSGGTTVATAATAGATSLVVTDASKFPSTGQLLVTPAATGTQASVTYTGITSNTLTGVSGLPAVAVGDPVALTGGGGVVPTGAIPTGDFLIRPRGTLGASPEVHANDVGLAVIAAGPNDPNGKAIGHVQGTTTAGLPPTTGSLAIASLED